jgi:hypothetical protein
MIPDCRQTLLEVSNSNKDKRVADRCLPWLLPELPRLLVSRDLDYRDRELA